MEDIDLKDVFKTFWNKKFDIIVILILFVIAGMVYTTNFVEPEYTSSTTLILASINTNSQDGTTFVSADTAVIDKDITVNSKLVSTYSELIKSNKNIRQVKDNLKIDIDDEELKKSIDVNTVEDTELIRISVTNKNNLLACDIANEIADVFKDQIKDYYSIENVQTVDVAEESDEPSNINHKRDIAIFILLGMVVACGYVLIINILDNTIKSIEDAEKVTKLTVLAALPIYDMNYQKTKKGGKKNEKRINNV